VDQLYAILTGREDTAVAAVEPSADQASPLTHPLPAASVGGLAGLVEIVAAHGGRYDLPELAAELPFEVDDLLPIVDAAVMLGLLRVEAGDAYVTDDGQAWMHADIDTSKRIFARLSRANAPLVRSIARALDASADGGLREGFFRDLLRRGYTEAETERQLDTAIDWGRYGELFDYDATTGDIHKPDTIPTGSLAGTAAQP